MSSMIESILPVSILILLGVGLRWSGLAGASFWAESDRLIYFVFLPLLLFHKTAGGAAVDGLLILSLYATIGAAWVLSLLFARLLRLPRDQVGPFAQNAWRFNNYLGLALAITALGEKGVIQLGLILGLTVPFVNLLAVITLFLYSERNREKLGERISTFLRSLVLNPLIIGCFAGLLYSWNCPALPSWLDKTLGLTDPIALTMALLSIGAGLRLGQGEGYLTGSLVAACIKLLFMPVLGFVLMKQLGVDGLPLQAAMIMLTCPTSTTNHILSAQFRANTAVAVNGVAISTILSPLSFGLLRGYLGS